MTDSVFFDTDCISAFLWINDQSILSTLYHGKIVIPQPVYLELSNSRVLHLKNRIDIMVSNGQAEIKKIEVGSDSFKAYNKLTTNPDEGQKIIGKGEAASIALAMEQGGIVASNNLSDINGYVDEFKLRHITTGDILIEAYKKDIITEQQGNTIWAAMLAKRRKIGANSFTDYLSIKQVN